MTKNIWILQTSLEPKACAERLRQAIDGDFDWFGSRPVQGSVRSDSALLRKRIGYRNSFQPVLAVAMTSAKGRTRLFCRTGMSGLVTAFLVVSMALLAMFWLVALAMWISDGAPLDSSILLLLTPVGMLGFGVALHAFCRYLARDEVSFLLTFLRETLEADLVEEPS